MSERHVFGQNEKEAGDYAEDLAASMLASTLGMKEDDGLTWNEQEQLWKLEGKILRTRNETQTFVVPNNHTWTTVVACGVLLF